MTESPLKTCRIADLLVRCWAGERSHNSKNFGGNSGFKTSFHSHLADESILVHRPPAAAHQPVLASLSHISFTFSNHVTILSKAFHTCKQLALLRHDSGDPGRVIGQRFARIERDRLTRVARGCNFRTRYTAGAAIVLTPTVECTCGQ